MEAFVPWWPCWQVYEIVKISFVRPAQLITIGAANLFPTCITIDRNKFEIVSDVGDVIGQEGDCTDAVSAYTD